MIQNSHYSVILWDWNGTLLDDIEVSIAAMNELLQKRNLPTLSRARYKEIFDFPVKDYYLQLGFDFNTEDWSQVSSEFMQAYHSKEKNIQLFAATIRTLKHFQTLGKKQYILSAMKTESIHNMLAYYSISNFFDGVYGLDNHYAYGKIKVAQQLLTTEKLNPKDCIMIGDTTHDAKVAKHMGVSCNLISHGHQSKSCLSRCGIEIINDLEELIKKGI